MDSRNKNGRNSPLISSRANSQLNQRPKTPKPKAKKINIQEDLSVSDLNSPRIKSSLTLTAPLSSSNNSRRKDKYVGFRPVSKTSSSVTNVDIVRLRNALETQPNDQKAKSVLANLEDMLAKIPSSKYSVSDASTKYSILNQLFDAYTFAWNEATLQIKDISQDHATVYAKIKEFYSYLLEQYPTVLGQYEYELKKSKDVLILKDKNINTLEEQLNYLNNSFEETKAFIANQNQVVDKLRRKKKFYKEEYNQKSLEVEKLQGTVTELRCQIVKLTNRIKALEEVEPYMDTLRPIKLTDSNLDSYLESLANIEQKQLEAKQAKEQQKQEIVHKFETTENKVIIDQQFSAEYISEHILVEKADMETMTDITMKNLVSHLKLDWVADTLLTASQSNFNLNTSSTNMVRASNTSGAISMKAEHPKKLRRVNSTYSKTGDPFSQLSSMPQSQLFPSIPEGPESTNEPSQQSEDSQNSSQFGLSLQSTHDQETSGRKRTKLSKISRSSSVVQIERMSQTILPMVEDTSCDASEQTLRRVVYTLMASNPTEFEVQYKRSDEYELKSFSWVFSKIIAIFVTGLQFEDQNNQITTFYNLVWCFLMHLYKTTFLTQQILTSLNETVSNLRGLNKVLDIYSNFISGHYDMIQFRFFHTLLEFCISYATPDLSTLMENEMITSDQTQVLIPKEKCRTIFHVLFPFHPVPFLFQDDPNSFTSNFNAMSLGIILENDGANDADKVDFWDYLRIMTETFGEAKDHLWSVCRNTLYLAECQDFEMISKANWKTFLGLLYPEIGQKEVKNIWNELSIRRKARGENEEVLNIESLIFYVTKKDEYVFQLMRVKTIPNFTQKYFEFTAPMIEAIHFIMNRVVEYLPVISSIVGEKLSIVKDSTAGIRGALFQSDIQTSIAIYQKLLHEVDGLFVDDFQRIQVSKNSTTSDIDALLNHIKDREKVTGLMTPDSK